MLPELIHCSDDGRGTAGQAVPLLVWRFPEPLLAVSSAPLGGGMGPRAWVVNATVPMSYSRTDPETHLKDLAIGLGLEGPGIGLLTGVDVTERVVARDGGAVVVATVGLGGPTWAAAPDGDLRRIVPRYAGGGPPAERHRVGTVNIVALVPVRLAEAALVNAVATVAEAKAQALWGLGIEATGTATDAVCVLCPTGGTAEAYGGPRSTWGARLARAVYGAVTEGGAAWLAGGSAWSDRTS